MGIWSIPATAIESTPSGNRAANYGDSLQVNLVDSISEQSKYTKHTNISIYLYTIYHISYTIYQVDIPCIHIYNIYRRTRKTWKRTSTATSSAGNLNQRHVPNNSQSGNSTQREPEPAACACPVHQLRSMKQMWKYETAARPRRV